jgi:glycosyltransferase involved in cell wall biosynthesis
MSRIKLLTFTSLYPNSVHPVHGIFVEQRLRKLASTGEIEAKVVAPVPWFPFKKKIFGRYAKFASVPRVETRHGITVLHPRYVLIPKVGMTGAPLLIAASVIFFPDGVAAALLASYFHKPLVITARGTDINLIPQYYLPRKMIQWAARRAASTITVCQALKDTLLKMGMAETEIRVLRNGVDLNLFRPVPRETARSRLGLMTTTLLSVGHLTEGKGHDIVIKALLHLPDVELLIAGEGEEEHKLKALASSTGVAPRVRFLGTIGQEQLKEYYSAADVFVLASSREGLANVLLEAMACGTPVVATNVGGTPEVISSPEAGVLMEHRTSEALVEAVHTLLANYPDRKATERHAQRFTWAQTTAGQLELFRTLLEQTDGK